MALTKSFILPNDTEVSYWVLYNVNINMSQSTACLRYKGYISEDSFNAGKDSIIDKVIDINLADLSGVGSTLSSFPYTLLSDLLDSESE